MNENPIIDICTEHKTKLQDDTPMQVTPCPWCSTQSNPRLFCEFHLQPKLAYHPNFKDTNKKWEGTMEIIERYNNFDGGHPCLSYTTDFWEKHSKQYEPPKITSYFKIQEETEESKNNWKQFTEKQKEIHTQETLHTSKKLLKSPSPKELEDKEVKFCPNCSKQLSSVNHIACPYCGYNFNPQKKSFWRRLFGANQTC